MGRRLFCEDLLTTLWLVETVDDRVGDAEIVSGVADQWLLRGLMNSHKFSDVDGMCLWD